MNTRNVAAIVALLLLAGTASYGVYQFQLLFVPHIVALISAASFEATYIGLAIATLTQTSKKRAAVVSLAAVAVSIVYNSLSALFHLSPELLAKEYLWLNGILALLHGLPLALVAYFVADLIIHQQVQTTSKIASKATSRITSKTSVATQANSRANNVAATTAKPKGRFVCSSCGYKAKNAKALNGHMTKHRNDKLS
jgi:hypothetical protein